MAMAHMTDGRHLLFLDEIPEDENEGVQTSRFLFYVEEMKKKNNYGFQKEFDVIIINLFLKIMKMLRTSMKLCVLF